MAERGDGTSTALSEAELVFERWVAQPDRGDIDELCRSHPDLARRLRTLQASYARATAALGSFADDPSAELRRVLERLGRPDVLSGYEDRGEVARGGMGEIRRVWDARLRRTLAMKLLSLAPGAGSSVHRRVERFLEEARIAGSLQHPGVAPVHDVGLSPEGRLYFTMPLIEGEDLRRSIDRLHADEEGWTVSRLLWNLVHVCETMAYAHSRGVVHRDLKPANVMVGRFGEVRVMDWGLAKVMGESEGVDIRPCSAAPEDDGEGAATLRTMDGDVLGTPGYMSPEQAEGRLEEVGSASDVYSIGCMLYHVLSGRAPYAASRGSGTPSPLEVLCAVRAGPPQQLEEVAPRAPTELVAICERAMARRARDRYSNTEELADDLRAWLDGRVVRAYETGAWAELRKWIARNRALAAAIAAVALTAVGGSTAVAVVQARAGADLRASNKLLIEADYFNSVALAQQAYDSANTVNMRALLDGVDPDLRGWEWHYLHRLTDTSLRTLRGHTGEISEVDWSPAGDRLASASRDGSVRVWDVESGEELFAVLGHADLVEDVAYAPDGSVIVSAGRDGTARLWDAESGVEVAVFPASENQLEAVAFAPGGEQVATGGEDAVVLLWDVRAPEAPVARLEGHVGQITTMRYSPDGAYLASGGYDGTVRVWDLRTSTQRHALRSGLAGRLRSLDFSPDGGTLFAASQNRDVVAWDVETGQQRQRFTNRASSHTVEVDPSGELLATSDFATLRLWDIASERSVRILCGHDAPVNCIAFSPDGTRIASGGTDRTLRLWDWRGTPAGLAARAADDFITDMVFGDDGWFVWSARDGHVRMAEAATLRAIDDYDPDQGWVTAVTYDPSRRVIASGGGDGSVVLRSLADGSERRIGTGARIWRVVIDGDLLATSHEDGAVRVIDLATERSVLDLQLEQRVTGLDLDRGRLLVGQYDGRVGMYALASGRLLLDLQASQEKHPSLAFSPDGRSFAVGSGDRSVRLYDAGTGEVRFSASGHEAGVACLAFTPDGSRLVTSGNDGLLKLWDTASGRQAFTLQADERGLSSIAVSPDGRRVAGASYSLRVVVFDAGPASITARSSSPPR